MTFPKRPTTNILTAFVLLSLFFLLWQTFGIAEQIDHSSFLTSAQLQSRHIKPQTLPESKTRNPLLRGAQSLSKLKAKDVQSHSVSWNVRNVELPVVLAPVAPPIVVTCSQDMSLPCFPGKER